MTKIPMPPAPGAAEHPCLALANTIVSLPGGQRLDEIGSPDEATEWLITQELAPAGTGLLSYCQLQLSDLRRNIRQVLGSHSEGIAPDSGALDAINRALTTVPSAALLRHVSNGSFLRVPSHPTTQLVDHAMAHIAEDAAALLTGPDAPRIARCASTPCDRFMVRTHARRQWCSERCGARQRAGRAYARKQSSVSP